MKPALSPRSFCFALFIVILTLSVTVFWQFLPKKRWESSTPKFAIRNRTVAASSIPPSGQAALLDETASKLAIVPSLTGDAAKAELRKSGQYETLGDALSAARHAVEKIDPAGPHSRGSEYFALNPRQQLRAWFSTEGVELASGRPSTDENVEPWKLNLRLLEIGRDGLVTKVSAGTTTGEGCRVEVHHRGAAVTQWFVNREDGLEQGFTIQERPQGDEHGEVALLLNVAGTLQAQSNDEQRSICFTDAEGAEVIHYTGLKAWDATGRTLAARLEGRGAEVAIHFADAGAQYPVFIDPLFVNVEARLNRTPQGAEKCGKAVSISGDRVLIGAPESTTSAGSEGGRAFVFFRTGNLWNLEDTLVAPDSFPSQWFGYSVSISGSTALVGAPKNRFNPNPANALPAAYVYIRDGTTNTWTLQQKIPEPDFNSAAQNLFGWSVAVSGDTALIGAPFDTNKKGSAYFFKRNGTAWTQQGGEIAPSGGTAGEVFGWSVALSGDSAVIGKPGGEAGQEMNGFAHVYTRSGTDWSPQQVLTSTSLGDRFGWSVALSGDTALVGAPSINFNRLPAQIPSFAPGSAYVFVRNGAVWNPQGRLNASDGVTGDVFGYSVAVSDTIGIVGSPYSVSSSNRGGGLAYIFEKSGNVWNEQKTVSAGIDSTLGDQFGEAIALSGNYAVIGASQDDAVGLHAGSAYTFLLGELPEITLHPVSQTVVPGQSVTVTVVATGYAPLRYQWRKDGSFIPSATSSSHTIPSAQLADQGRYDCVVSNTGGVVTSSSASLRVNALSQFAQSFPGVPPDAQGFVFVTLSPPGVGGWRFQGEQLWRTSGVPVGGLATGDRLIEFRPMPGYIQPPLESVSVVSSGAATLIERVYYETPTSGSGGLSVSLKPASLAAASVPQAERAQWRLFGEDDTQWRDSDAAFTGLLPGSYLVECKPVAGRTTPPSSTVLVQDLQTAVITLTYFLTDSVTGTPPNPLPLETVSTDTSQPYAHVGQIRSNVGSSSGFVVKRRVVATAGHVVFDDGTLSAVTGLQWLFQRHRGTYEPKPQTPRGYYIFDGYAAQRAVENTPGSSSPLSQNLDVAALYFLEDAGRTGYSGFLASDATDNEFLLSSARKMLVGYPVDGISPINQGRMHATPAANVGFTRAFDRTYTTPDIRSSGGMSGGPLCVQFENGNYYPAAIYLGGTGQTVVRSIGSQVIDLFTRAEVSGNGGDNNTGGGITHTGVTNFGNTSNPGAIKVTILPAAAASAGHWGLKPETSDRMSGSTSSGRAAGDYILRLTTISGFKAPALETVRITGGQLKEITYTYEAEQSPPSITSANSATGRRGQPLSYQIVADQSPTSYSVSGNLPNGITLNTETGMISGTLQQAGVFTITLRATNGGGTGTRSLSLICRPAVSNQSATATLGQPISRQINSSESGPDVNYSADDLPPGTTLNEATGLITGIPTQAGVFPCLFTVTKDGASASAILTFTVTATPLELWRMANFQTTSSIGNASNTADPDKDGQTNLSEYAAGTDPNSAADVFKILTTSKGAASFTVTAAGKASRSYMLERRTTLLTGAWTTVTSVGPLASDGPLALTDFAPASNSAFYRLRASAP